MMKLCKACGCEKDTTEFHKDKSKTDGLNSYCKACQIAKQREYAMRPPRHQAPEGMKRCQHCKETKPQDEFYARATSHDGLAKICKLCSGANHERWRLKNLEKCAEDGRKWRANNPERAADHGRKANYGMPLGTYDAMLIAQDGKCAICRSDAAGGKGSFHVDHCHDKGHVRGLLCHNCNVGIGHFQHRASLLRTAADYVEKLP